MKLPAGASTGRPSFPPPFSGWPEALLACPETPEGLHMQMKTTFWIDQEDNPLIIHEGDSVLIEVTVIGSAHAEAVDVFVAPALFGALRGAMDKAEEAKQTSRRT
jgi:hypothetical protein